ncbi:MAG: SMC-Scp complex subunit ScpB [Phycisphaerales bacterium]|nr:SMC-Scp complex subunit ScpB [Phycisphaerales bacterium]
MQPTDTQPTTEAEAHAEPEQASSAPLRDEPFTAEEIPAAVEAVLLAMDKPIGAALIAQAVGLADAGAAKAVKAAVEALNTSYDAGGRSFRIEQVSGGYRIMTRARFAPAVAAVRGLRETHRLSRAAVETLAIIAYRQPITRVTIEAIRGVACGEVLRTLLEKRLIDIAGRAEELGRPMLYGTSKRFLEIFGLASLKDLPAVGEVFPGLEVERKDLLSAPRPSSEQPAEGAAGGGDQ